MSKRLPYDQAKVVYDKVLSIRLDDIQPIHNERPYQDQLAKDIRAMLKTHGLNSRQISVTKADGAMCYWVYVTLPRIEYDLPRNMTDEQYAAFEEQREHRYKAQWHLNSVIARSFPGCKDRSDAMTDYFDFVYTVH